MSYRAELDDYHQAARYGTRFQSLFWWPKVPGEGNVTVASGSTVSIYAPGSSTPIVDQAVTTNSTSGGYTRMLYDLDARDTATWPIAENYRALWAYTPVGQTGLLLYKTTLFDVAVEPYQPSVSLNNFLEEEVASAEILERQAAILADGRTAEQHASILANKAWSDVREWIRQAMSADGKTIARAIMDHQSIGRVVIAQAMARMYRAEGGGPESVAAQRYDDWKRDAWGRFKSLPPIAYDSNQDGIPDSTVRGPMTVVPERSW